MSSKRTDTLLNSNVLLKTQSHQCFAFLCTKLHRQLWKSNISCRALKILGLPLKRSDNCFPWNTQLLGEPLAMNAFFVSKAIAQRAEASGNTPAKPAKINCLCRTVESGVSSGVFVRGFKQLVRTDGWNLCVQNSTRFPGYTFSDECPAM